PRAAVLPIGAANARPPPIAARTPAPAAPAMSLRRPMTILLHSLMRPPPGKTSCSAEVGMLWRQFIAARPGLQKRPAGPIETRLTPEIGAGLHAHWRPGGGPAHRRSV